MWIDTHCHVYDERTPGGADASIDNAHAQGIDKIIVIGTDAATTTQALAIAARHDNVWATVGLHPHDSKLGVDTVVPFVDGLDAQGLATQKIVAIGECGLDYFYDHSERDAQREAFAQQISLAKQLDLSLVIHTRSAWPDTFDVLDAEGMPDRVIFHCFTGDEAEARAAVERGAWLSFSGIVTFAKADDIRRAAKFCPADKLLTETDAPWLAPVPHRGKENEPALVRVVGECLAQVRGESAEEIARTTVRNAHEAFPGIAR
ncbi:MAG: TatD family hydrolase [Acidimicrobiia bacterium]